MDDVPTRTRTHADVIDEAMGDLKVIAAWGNPTVAGLVEVVLPLLAAERARVGTR